MFFPDCSPNSMDVIFSENGFLWNWFPDEILISTIPFSNGLHMFTSHLEREREAYIYIYIYSTYVMSSTLSGFKVIRSYDINRCTCRKNFLGTAWFNLFRKNGCPPRSHSGNWCMQSGMAIIDLAMDGIKLVHGGWGVCVQVDFFSHRTAWTGSSLMPIASNPAKPIWPSATIKTMSWYETGRIYLAIIGSFLSVVESPLQRHRNTTLFLGHALIVGTFSKFSFYPRIESQNSALSPRQPTNLSHHECHRFRGPLLL